MTSIQFFFFKSTIYYIEHDGSLLLFLLILPSYMVVVKFTNSGLSLVSLYFILFSYLSIFRT